MHIKMNASRRKNPSPLLCRRSTRKAHALGPAAAQAVHVDPRVVFRDEGIHILQRLQVGNLESKVLAVIQPHRPTSGIRLEVTARALLPIQLGLRLQAAESHTCPCGNHLEG
eukprot:CAMPEP_0203983460 /NCGR_PEP_ID=MMETSP0360-20130528/3855_1 /ASSEMBLY_ACC=CAM_ASM_000342 /TAXON_ID=268821 /ORGANISM="Scrippsiella Hangoei, Strain SHTV-5" /LENGTH=111 /DNA_ID=CAMNT_0050922373 /DNA_START=77 /DNA_END=412 /DNA_ORIENTATION=-